MKCSTPPTTEIWKAIVGTAGRYEASNLGRVRAKFSSAGRPRTNANIFDGELVSAYIGDRDFQNVMIDQKVWSVAACVLSASVGPRPSNDHKACYLDGDRLNVKLSNLAWLTTAENKKAYAGPRPIGIETVQAGWKGSPIPVPKMSGVVSNPWLLQTCQRHLPHWKSIEPVRACF